VTDSSSIPASAVTIGAPTTHLNNFLNGYISNLRVVNGTAVYTAAFTPSTSPLTAITNTVLLTCQSNRFVDNSTSAATFTPSGTITVQRFNPFGDNGTPYSPSPYGGSCWFDGSSGYLPASSGTSMAFGT